MPIDSGTERSAPIDAADAANTADAADAAVICRGDLSNIGTADFHVSFVVTTTQRVFAALVNQRGVCAHAVFWDIRMTSGGLLAVETDDATSYTPVTSVGTRVNDGLPHDVRIQRAAGTLTVSVDGTASGSARSLASFGPLARLRTRTDACTFAIDGTTTFAGTIADLCVASP